MKWDDMQPSENGRFCSQCQKQVFDLTNCSIDEVRALQQKHGKICGSIKLMGAAVVAASMSTAACDLVNPSARNDCHPPAFMDDGRSGGEIAPLAFEPE
jgi:hypothetical protein